jgi:transposase-like protein
MKLIPRLLGSAGVTAIVLTTLTVFSPPWLRESEESSTRLISFDPAEEDLERRRQEVLWREETKLTIARDVADGRVSLMEAASRFRTLAENTPDFRWNQFRQSFPGGSDEERHCQAVIVLLEADLMVVDPARAEKCVAMLQAELRELLKKGTPRLPEKHPRRCPQRSGREVLSAA